MKSNYVSCAAGVLGLSMLAGCQSLDMGLIGKADLPSAGPQNPVTEIVCLWEPAEGIGLDNLPTRGFAGQILFFTPGSPEPVRVNGDVRIYVFDNHGTPEEQARPIHQFDFPADAWNTHLRETNMGATYQLFVPYTRKGGYSAECVLRVRLTPHDSLPVYSKMSTINLVGRRPPGEAVPEEEAVETRDPELAAEPPTAAVNDLLMPIDLSDVASRQPAALSLQRSPLPDTRGLDAAIEQALRSASLDGGDGAGESSDSLR